MKVGAGVIVAVGSAIVGVDSGAAVVTGGVVHPVNANEIITTIIIGNACRGIEENIMSSSLFIKFLSPFGFFILIGQKIRE